jgi:hypothetical protein
VKTISTTRCRKKVKERHPDFEDIRNSDDFHGWAKEQPASIQAWIYEILTMLI